MKRIDLYLSLRRDTLEAERKDLLTALDRLIQEAQLYKEQVAAGKVFKAGLGDRGRTVDELAVGVRSLLETLEMLESIQKDGE
jgi:hypothetical protein